MSSYKIRFAQEYSDAFLGRSQLICLLEIYLHPTQVDRIEMVVRFRNTSRRFEDARHAPSVRVELTRNDSLEIHVSGASDGIFWGEIAKELVCAPMLRACLTVIF